MPIPFGILRIKIFCCLLSITFYFHANSQHAQIQSFNINDGLVCNQVRGFYQDKRGFIWIMTWEGLSRFDGNSFRNYTLAEGLNHPMINAMIEGSDGNIYVADNDGIVDVIINGEVVKELRNDVDEPINKFIRDRSGIILAPSDEIGLRVFNDGTVSVLNNTENNFTVFDAISTNDYFLVCGIKSGVVNHDQTLIKEWPDQSVLYHTIFKDNLNRIWVGTSSGLSWVNLNPGDSDMYELIETPFRDAPWSRWIVRDIIQTSDGSIWIAATGGLVQVKSDGSWRIYSRNDGLPTEYITAIFEDRAGFLWVGTDLGIAKLDIKNTIDVFTIGEDLPNYEVTDILPTQDGGALIISDKGSVYEINRNQSLQPIQLDHAGEMYEFSMFGSDTLLSTSQGRYILNGDELKPWSKIPFFLSELTLELEGGCIFSTKFRTIYIACPNKTYTDTTLNDMIFALSSGLNDEIWIGTINQGVYKIIVHFDEAGKIELEWENFNDYLPEKFIRSLHADKIGNIWIGTRYSGLVQLYMDSLTGKYSTHVFDRSDGFISDFVKSIDSDKEGNIWVGTHAGIEKLIPTPNGYRTFSFSRVHNFFAIVNELKAGPDKSIWCVTTSGVVRIIDSRYETIPPSGVYITSVSTARGTFSDPQLELPFDLNYQQNFLDINFSSNDQINGTQVKYSYRLIGSQDTTWSDPLPVHKVSYANLLPGDYNFEVRVLGWNGELGKKTIYSFNIKPPFWQRIWFVIFSIASLLGLLFLFYRYRISQLKRVQEVRDRIASDLHDEIGSSLTHVNILSEIGRKNAIQDDQHQQLFKRIGEEVQTSAEALDDIIWSVSSRADTAEDLVSRMRRYASELFDTKGISFSSREIHLNENQTIGLELRRDLYLIYKELLRNILKHANATEVSMSIKEEGTFLWLCIRDNGQGFDTDAPSDRQGLFSIKRRVARWKGRFSIESSVGKGTTVLVEMPLKPGLSPKT